MKIITKIIFKLIHRKSNLYIRYLKKNGVAIGKNCKMLDPSTCIIDVTRPSLVTIGDNVLINRKFTLLTHDYVSGDEIDDYPDIPIESQLGSTYISYRDNHRALFKSFEEFLEKAEVK